MNKSIWKEKRINTGKALNQWQINSTKQHDSGLSQQSDAAAVARSSIETAAQVVNRRILCFVLCGW